MYKQKNQENDNIIAPLLIAALYLLFFWNKKEAVKKVSIENPIDNNVEYHVRTETNKKTTTCNNSYNEELLQRSKDINLDDYKI